MSEVNLPVAPFPPAAGQSQADREASRAGEAFSSGSRVLGESQRPPEQPPSGGRPSFRTMEDALLWALTEIGAVLLGLPRQRLEELSAWDVPILEAHRARRTIEILAGKLASSCPNPRHQVEPDLGDVAQVIADATKEAAQQIPIRYRKEP